MTDCERAKEQLQGDVTLALAKGTEIILSEQKGIAPMLGFLADGAVLQGYSAADRIVGKAAAMLFVCAGISAVYAEVMSVRGKEYLEAHGIPAAYGTLTDVIINRRGDGMCPMEETVWDIDDAGEGYAALVRKAELLRRQTEQTKTR